MRSLILLAALIAIAPPAGGAAISNGDFETGDLTGWSTSVSHFQGGAPSAHLEGNVRIAIARSDDQGASVLLTAESAYRFVEVPGFFYSVPQIEGAQASIAQTFTAYAGQSLSFDARFSGLLGTAIIQLIGPDLNLTEELSNRFYTSLAPWKTFLYPIARSGEYTFTASASSRGQWDYGTPQLGNCDFYIDNVRLVPEPATLALGLLAVAVLGVSARCRR